MGELIGLAARNNIFQSEAVLAALGSTGSFTDHFWTNQHTFDVPYANGATLGAVADIQQHYTAIEHLTASRPLEVPTFIMDSWAALDLSELGYRVRLSDGWFVRAGPPLRGVDDTCFEVETITTSKGIAEFEAASAIGFGGAPPDTSGHTYPAALLSDERFTFSGLRVDGILASGVFLFEDPACVGVFTFFTLPAYRGRGLGSSVLRHALSHAPNLPLATNPSSMSRGIFERLNFQAAGERRIWVRNRG